uniref:Galactose oxidase n=1 Tax=Kalmanozyma brasiliensis (strain GHG001) TaxID=1365824 RepID=V5EY99_KALBG
MLSDGTILMLGGMDASGQLQSLQDLYAFSSKSGTWSHTSTQSAANGTLQARQAAYPAPRRDHIAVSLPDQRVFIQGGASADLSTVYSDAWILDWSVNPPVWTQVDSADGPGARDDSSGGAKAGAAVGAIIGAGLVVGAGYAVYRRRTQNDYRRYGESKAGILGFGGRHNGGSADDDLLMEKGFMQSDYNRPYHHADGGAEDGAGLTGGVAYGRRRGRTEGSPWVAGNMGHAMEGSGPHFRERIAILAGRSRRESQAAPRFDMLADEGDGSSVYTTRQADSINRSYADGADEPESPTWPQRHMREHSYANAGDEDLSSGDIGQFSHDDRQAHDELDMYSPFEDRPEETRAGLTSAIAAAAGARGYGKLADRDLEGSYDSEHRSHDGRSDLDTHEDPSVQSHSTTSRSDVPSSSKSYDVTSSGGIVSFSDASHGRQSNSSNGMKRSSTWWDRLTGHSSAMERSSSGRLLASPHANLPIRDPAPPPVSGLAVITESARSREVSEVLPDPFADSNASGTDEHGRRVGADGTPEPYTAHTQGPSLSSIGSARTGASSHFESQLRGMDVIQRVRTGSSRRTQSTRASDTDSEPALSRGPTLLRPRNIPSDGNDASTLDPASKRLGDLVEEPARRPSNVSETPSITPLTTKRARLNPVMISPLFPSTSPRRSAPLAAGAAATVRDKVRAFESATSSQDTSAWTASMSSVLPRTAPTTTDEGVERATSPPLSESAARRPKVVHGLAPRPQLFVANPDAHGRRTSGSDGSGH